MEKINASQPGLTELVGHDWDISVVTVAWFN